MKRRILALVTVPEIAGIDGRMKRTKQRLTLPETGETLIVCATPAP